MTLRTHDHRRRSWPGRADRQRGGVLRHVHRADFSIRSTWRLFIRFRRAGWPAWKVAGGRRDPGRRQRGGGDLAAPVSLLLRRLVLVFGHVVSGAGAGQVSAHAMADRYMYLPGIGLYIAVAWGAIRLCAESPAGRRLLAGVGGLAIALPRRAGYPSGLAVAQRRGAVGPCAGVHDQ